MLKHINDLYVWLHFWGGLKLDLYCSECGAESSVLSQIESICNCSMSNYMIRACFSQPIFRNPFLTVSAHDETSIFWNYCNGKGKLIQVVYPKTVFPIERRQVRDELPPAFIL